LAHRFAEQVLPIDEVISGQGLLQSSCHRILSAKNNRSFDNFIDDNDVIFENKDDFGCIAIAKLCLMD